MFPDEPKEKNPQGLWVARTDFILYEYIINKNQGQGN